jgi:hypothetical protein
MKLERIAVATLALVAAGAGGFAAASMKQEGFAPPEPTKQHEWLATHVGTWDAEISSMMGGTSKGTYTIRSGPGGLWTVGDFEGEMMGSAFTGMEVVGYDPATEKFTSIWVDSMTMTHQALEGTYDAEAKKLVFEGEGPGMDGQPAKMTNTYHYKDENTIEFSMGMAGPDGSDMPMMTIVYTRK